MGYCWACMRSITKLNFVFSLRASEELQVFVWLNWILLDPSKAKRNYDLKCQIYKFYSN